MRSLSDTIFGKRTPDGRTRLSRTMKRLQSANASFCAINQIDAAIPIHDESHCSRTNDELIPLERARARACIGVDFQTAETRRFRSEFRRCQFRKTVLPNIHIDVFPPRAEIESAQPITTTVYRGAYACTSTIDVPTFPIVDEMINQSPCGPIVRQLARADGSIWFDTLQAIPMITCSPAQCEQKFNFDILDHQRWPYRASYNALASTNEMENAMWRKLILENWTAFRCI